jgi:2-polyprenyl-6-methoxyphenol hydroxylase-like FAD-dependent oxidoreductase
MNLPAAMWGVSRQSLDGVLLNEARQAGVEVRQPVRCEGIEAGQSVTLRLRDLASNAVESMGARFAVVAEGKSALLRPKPSATADLGVKAHFAGLRWDPDAVGLFAVHGHYGGVAPIERRLWNFAMSVPAARVQACGGDLDALFAAMVDENRWLRECTQGGERVTPWLTSALPRFTVRGDWPDRVVPVGNAAAAIEPIGGEGMGLAMRSGELAGHEIAAALCENGDINVRRLRGGYRKLWNTRGWGCRAAGWLFSHKALSDAGLPLVEDHTVGRVGLWLMGK